jgi:hypothetical protein
MFLGVRDASCTARRNKCLPAAEVHSASGVTAVSALTIVTFSSVRPIPLRRSSTCRIRALPMSQTPDNIVTLASSATSTMAAEWSGRLNPYPTRKDCSQYASSLFQNNSPHIWAILENYSSCASIYCFTFKRVSSKPTLLSKT